MKIKILTPSKLILEKNCDSVTLPGEAGQFTVLLGHDRMLSTLKTGVLYFRYRDAEDKEHCNNYKCGAGAAEALKDSVNIFVNYAEKM